MKIQNFSSQNRQKSWLLLLLLIVTQVDVSRDILQLRKIEAFVVVF